jgi:site-specific DNA-methyltransferase (adenine-specific)
LLLFVGFAPDTIGYIAFSDKTEVLPALLSVKSGKNVGVAEVRDLFGVVKSEGAACGIYITRHEPTQPMKDFAKQQGQFKPENFPPFERLQIVTVQEILDGARMNLPLTEEVTKRAQRAKTGARQVGFGFDS